jgi:hypothetical protein
LRCLHSVSGSLEYTVYKTKLLARKDNALVQFVDVHAAGQVLVSAMLSPIVLKNK